MAYFVDLAINGATGGYAAVAMNMPQHQADDILIAEITIDTGTATVGGSSWAALPSAPANPITQGIISYLLYIKAAGSSETLTLTTGDATTCNIYCFRDVDGTIPFDAVTPRHSGVAVATTTPASESVTTQTANALVVYLVMQDGAAPQVLSNPGVMSIYNSDAGGTTATLSAHQSAAWYITRSAGASPTPNWKSNISGVYVRATFALRNVSGGRIPAYIDDVSSPATVVTPGHHVAAQNGISFSGSGAFVITANVGALTLTQQAAANGADFGVNPYCNAFSATAAIVARTAMAGQELVITSPINMSNGLLMGTFIAGTPKMGLFGIGSIGEGGVMVRIGSAAGYWNAYQIAAKDSQITTEQRCLFAIQPGYDGTDYAAGASGNCDVTAVKYIQCLNNAPAFASAKYASEIHYVQKQVVAGGDANYPVDIDGLVAVGRSFRLPVIQKAGPNGCLSFAPVQIGGGDTVNFQVDAGAIQFPRRADLTRKDIQYHAADNKVGLNLYGVSGDVIKITNSLISSPTPFFFTFDANATNAATWDLTGTAIIGATVTLRNVMTFNSLSFTSCLSLDFTGCTVQNSKISKVPAGNDTLTTNGSTNIDDCRIDVSGVTAGNRWCSVADPTIFNGCTFIGGGGHAIRITSAGTYSLVANFTGFGADGSTGAALLIDGVAVIINASGGTAPTYKAINGGSCTVVTGLRTIKVVAQLADGTKIGLARVLLRVSADATSGFPYDDTVTIVNSGATATVTHTAHGMLTNDKVQITGASLTANNGVFSITKINDNSYSYTMGSSPGSSPTGTIKATFVFLEGTTDNTEGATKGEISMSRSIGANQAVTGWARKASSNYKQGPLSGTVLTSGDLTLTAILAPDA